MYKKLSFLLLCTLFVGAPVSAKTGYGYGHTGGLTTSIIGVNFEVDTCVLAKDVQFEQKSRFEFAPTWSCSDFDDFYGVIYSWQGGVYSREDMEYMLDQPENQAGAVLSVEFKANIDTVNKRQGVYFYYVDYRKLSLRSSVYRMTLKELTKTEGRGMVTPPLIDASTIRNGRVVSMREHKTGTPNFWYEGDSPAYSRTGAGPTTSTATKPSGTTTKPASTTRAKIMSDMLQEMIGKTMDTVRKDWSKPVNESKTGKVTELTWETPHGLLKNKTCSQKLYFDNSTNKVIGWSHDCPEGYYGKMPASTPVPKPYK